jgi:hypothetical protein
MTEVFTMTKEQLTELLTKEMDTSLIAGSTLAFEALEDSLKDWRFNLIFRLAPGFVLRACKNKQSREVAQ